jgi:hypothetical protein
MRGGPLRGARRVERGSGHDYVICLLVAFGLNILFSFFLGLFFWALYSLQHGMGTGWGLLARQTQQCSADYLESVHRLSDELGKLNIDLALA